MKFKIFSHDILVNIMLTKMSKITFKRDCISSKMFQNKLNTFWNVMFINKWYYCTRFLFLVYCLEIFSNIAFSIYQVIEYWKYTNIDEALDHDVITFRWWMKYVKIRLGSENCEKRTFKYEFFKITHTWIDWKIS